MDIVIGVLANAPCYPAPNQWVVGVINCLLASLVEQLMTVVHVTVIN